MDSSIILQYRKYCFIATYIFIMLNNVIHFTKASWIQGKSRSRDDGEVGATRYNRLSSNYTLCPHPLEQCCFIPYFPLFLATGWKKINFKTFYHMIHGKKYTLYVKRLFFSTFITRPFCKNSEKITGNRIDLVRGFKKASR